jgi:hypothetical protein
MKVSYLVTCSTETDTLQRLLEVIGTLVKNSDDEVVILCDTDNINNENTQSILLKFTLAMQHEIICKKICKIVSRSLNQRYGNVLTPDYGAHKNFGIEQCTGDFIFQIDGDEMPPVALLGENLHALLEANPTIEAYAVGRANDFRGVTDFHAKQWGWKLTPSTIIVHEKIINTNSEEYKFLLNNGFILKRITNSELLKTPEYVKIKYKAPLVNFPDYQWRLFKNDPKIRFKNRLHEKIEGYTSYSILPADEDYALYHDKTIAIQTATNERYNKMFTQDENRGVSNPR